MTVRTHDLYLAGLGMYLPPGRASVELALASGQCGAEFRGGGLVSVSVADNIATVDMAISAGREAVRQSGRQAAQIDLLLHASMFWQGPQGWSPVGYLLRELGCGDAAGHEVVQGCNGILAALELAAGWLALTDDDATALLTTALNVAGSRSVNRWRSGGYGIALGDGAAAVLVRKDRGFARVDSVNSMTACELEGLHRGTASVIESHGGAETKVDVPARTREFAITSGLAPVDFYGQVVKAYSQVAHRSLEEAGIRPDELARVIFSNVAPNIIDVSIMQPLGLPLSMAAWDAGRYVGHLGAGDHVASLDDLMRKGELSAGDRILLASGTAGYNVASAVLTITGTTPG